MPDLPPASSDTHSPATAADDAFRPEPVHANKGLRAIALFEATKGLLVLMAGVGVLGLLHRDVQQVAEELVRSLRLNPNSHYPQTFLEWSSHVTHGQLWWTASASVVYCAFRLAEAYGLWTERTWAELLAVLSGVAPMPFEILGLYRHPSGFKFGLLGFNVLIVLYVMVLMVHSRRRAARLPPEPI